MGSGRRVAPAGTPHPARFALHTYTQRSATVPRFL